MDYTSIPSQPTNEVTENKKDVKVDSVWLDLAIRFSATNVDRSGDGDLSCTTAY